MNLTNIVNGFYPPSFNQFKDYEAYYKDSLINDINISVYLKYMNSPNELVRMLATSTLYVCTSKIQDQERKYILENHLIQSLNDHSGNVQWNSINSLVEILKQDTTLLNDYSQCIFFDFFKSYYRILSINDRACKREIPNQFIRFYQYLIETPSHVSIFNEHKDVIYINRFLFLIIKNSDKESVKVGINFFNIYYKVLNEETQRKILSFLISNSKRYISEFIVVVREFHQRKYEIPGDLFRGDDLYYRSMVIQFLKCPAPLANWNTKLYDKVTLNRHLFSISKHQFQRNYGFILSLISSKFCVYRNDHYFNLLVLEIYLETLKMNNNNDEYYNSIRKEVTLQFLKEFGHKRSLRPDPCKNRMDKIIQRLIELYEYLEFMFDQKKRCKIIRFIIRSVIDSINSKRDQLITFGMDTIILLLKMPIQTIRPKEMLLICNYISENLYFIYRSFSCRASHFFIIINQCKNYLNSLNHDDVYKTDLSDSIKKLQLSLYQDYPSQHNKLTVYIMILEITLESSDEMLKECDIQRKSHILQILTKLKEKWEAKWTRLPVACNILLNALLFYDSPIQYLYDITINSFKSPLYHIDEYVVEMVSIIQILGDINQNEEELRKKLLDLYLKCAIKKHRVTPHNKSILSLIKALKISLPTLQEYIDQLIIIDSNNLFISTIYQTYGSEILLKSKLFNERFEISEKNAILSKKLPKCPNEVIIPMYFFKSVILHLIKSDNPSPIIKNLVFNLSLVSWKFFEFIKYLVNETDLIGIYQKSFPLFTVKKSKYNLFSDYPQFLNVGANDYTFFKTYQNVVIKFDDFVKKGISPSFNTLILNNYTFQGGLIFTLIKRFPKNIISLTCRIDCSLIDILPIITEIQHITFTIFHSSRTHNIDNYFTLIKSHLKDGTQIELHGDLPINSGKEKLYHEQLGLYKVITIQFPFSFRLENVLFLRDFHTLILDTFKVTVEMVTDVLKESKIIEMINSHSTLKNLLIINSTANFEFTKELLKSYKQQSIETLEITMLSLTNEAIYTEGLIKPKSNYTELFKIISSINSIRYVSILIHRSIEPISPIDNIDEIINLYDFKTIDNSFTKFERRILIC